jgi:hypothetical protein
MTYACPAWEFAADSHPLKLQCLQNIDLRITGNLPRRTQTRTQTGISDSVRLRLCNRNM